MSNEKDFLHYVIGWNILYEDYKKKNDDYNKLPNIYKSYLSLKNETMIHIINNQFLYELDNVHFTDKEIDTIVNHYELQLKRLIYVIINGVSDGK